MSDRAAPTVPSPRASPPSPRRAELPSWPIRIGLRARLIVLFTVAFTLVLAGLGAWSTGFTEDRLAQFLRSDLDDTLTGIAENLDGDEIAGLARDGAPNASGGSNDRRWRHLTETLEAMHRVEKRAYASVLVRGDQLPPHRVGDRAPPPEFVWIAGLGRESTAPKFLEPHAAKHPELMRAWEQKRLVQIPGTIDSPRLGRVMTSVGPIRGHDGTVAAILVLDFDVREMEKVARDARRGLAIAGVVTYAVVVLLIYLAAGLFTRPIEQLTRYAESLDQAHVGATPGLEKRTDELGALARSFGRMSQRLASAFGDLERANDDLERRVSERTAELSTEREKSERLLRNVLPAQIAERLKSEPHAMAEAFDAVTVLFADIVGFTAMSARSAPIAVVRLLNDIFSSFDTLAEKYGLEKIKTIGDAYMIVGGLPTPRPDHALAVAAMALEMQAVMVKLDERYPGLSIRIGIHTGPVVAGVIGTKKFSYDLWGDTVNVASRMESHGEPGRIQVSEAMAAVLTPQFVVEPRGLIQVKGRGELRTFWLMRRATP